jgi:hypothetical protein
MDWAGKRAKLAAKDDSHHSLEHLACMRFVYEQLRLWDAIVIADMLTIYWLLRVGNAWMSKGTKCPS